VSQVTGSTTEPARPVETRPEPRSPDQIEAEIEATRTALAGRLDLYRRVAGPPPAPEDAFQSG
jgi:hypothetical protein